MNRRWLILSGVIAFSIALAVVAGFQLASTGALAVALGVGVGTVVGVGASLLLLRGRFSTSAAHDPDKATIVLPRREAEKLIKMLNSRNQADPDAFPLTAERERRFTAVGGASLDEDFE